MSQLLIKRHIFCAMNAHFTDMFNHMYISSSHCAEALYIYVNMIQNKCK